MTTNEDSTLPLLVREHGPALHRYATRLLRDTSVEADDVLQEVWLRAHDTLRADRAPANVAAWLRVVTHNCAMDARRATVALSAAGVPAELPELRAVTDEVERRDELREVLGDLAALDGRQRFALLRHAVDGVAHDQLAAELDATPQASKSLVLRARRNLERRATARSLACIDIRAAIESAHRRGVRAPEHVRLHVAQCRGCRHHRRKLRGGFRALFPWLSLKVAVVLGTAATVTTAAWSVTRYEQVEPWKGPTSPSWTLGPGTAFSRHHLTIAEDARGRPVDLPLRCPRGYGLFQFDFGRQNPPAEVEHGEALTWIGAPVKTMRIRPLPGRLLPTSLDLEVTCLTPDRLRPIRRALARR